MPPILLPDPAEVLRGPAPGVEPPALHPEHPCFLPLVLLASCSVVLAAVALEGMMLKLKLQYFGHLMLRVDSLDQQNLWKPNPSGRGTWGLQSMGSQRVRHN